MRMKTRSSTGFTISLALMTGTLFLQAVEVADVQTGAKAAPDLALKPEGERRATAHAHLLTARMLENEERMREALGHYLAFLQNNTGDPELVEHIADLALRYHGLDAALELLEGALRANPGLPEPYVNFTRFALTHADEKNGLLQRAVTAANDAVKRFPQSPEVHENAARLQLAQGQREAAARILDEAAKQASSETSYWLGLGRVALEVWPLADGENRAAHLAKVNPFFEKARRLAQAAHDEDAELRAADFFLFSNQLGAATEICEAIVKRNGSLDARKRLVRLYDAMERPDDTFKALQDLVTAYPQDVEHRKMLATHHMQRAVAAARAFKPDESAAENQKAVEHLEAALQAGGGDLNDYLQISNLLRFTQQPDKFDHFTARAQQLFPGEPRITYYRSIALNQLKQYAAAAKTFTETAKLAETRAPELLDDQFHFAWGVALERSGQFDEAARQFEASIKLTPPEDPPRAASTMNYLGYMWLDRGQHLDRAETLIRKANEMDPDNAAFVDSLGWLLFKQGKVAQALPELLKAEELLRKEQPDPEPGDAEIFDHIAQTYDKLGQREKALDYWKRALDVKPEVEAIRERAEKELGLQKPKPPEPAQSGEEPQKPAAAAGDKTPDSGR